MRGAASDRSVDVLVAWLGCRRSLAVVLSAYREIYRVLRSDDDYRTAYLNLLNPPSEEPTKPKRAPNYLMKDGTPRISGRRLALPAIGGTHGRLDEVLRMVKRVDKKQQERRIKGKKRVGGGALVRVGAQRLDRRG